MKPTFNDAVAAAARWIATVQPELQQLGEDLRLLIDDVQSQWQSDAAFRTTVMRELFEGLTAVALRGPRATAIWAVHVLGHLIAFIATALDRNRPSFGTEH